MSSYKLVVAKYKENIDWLQYFNKKNYIIYDKSNNPIDGSIKRPNIGREAETFIHYIIEIFDNLSDYTILAQGDPFEHMDSQIRPENFSYFIEKFIEFGYKHTIPLFIYQLYENTNSWAGMKTREYFMEFFNKEAPLQVVFAPGSQYITPKECILKRPREFYIKLRNMIINGSKWNHYDAHYKELKFSSEEINGWVVERLMFYILSGD